MRFEDMIRSSDMGRTRVPNLKGHVKVTLHNCRTGKNEVWEGDNIVTNAIRDIFAMNLLGGISYSKLLPLYQTWFGGILCYDTAHTIDADNYFPQAGHGLTAHAGDIAPSTAAIINEDLSRGSPLHVDTSHDDSVTMTWEWGSEQGNGDIASLSLTHKDTGNVGLGNNSSAFKAYTPFDILSDLPTITGYLNAEQNTFCQYDDNHGLAFYIGEDGEFKGGYTKFTTTKISVQIKKLAFLKAGLYELLSGSNTHARKFTVNTSVTFYRQPSYWFDYTNKRLWLFSNATGIGDNAFSRDTIYYTVIDCENGTEYDHGSIVIGEDCLAPIEQDRTTDNNYNQPRFTTIVRIGNYFYFPTTNIAPSAWNRNNFETNPFTGFVKVNITNVADYALVPYSETRYKITSGISGGCQGLTDGAVIRGNNAYNCAEIFPYGTKGDAAVFNQMQSPVAYMFPMNGGYTYSPRYIVANKMVNSTLFNLDSPIHKTTAKSLNIQYTLTET